MLSRSLLLGIYALARHLRSPLGLLGAGIVLQALAYVPFYFDGDYPGGGARFLCEAIPFCQILVARAALDLRVGWLAPLLALAGFALHARRGHEALRDREGGRPLFEPAVLSQAGLERGLVLVDTPTMASISGMTPVPKGRRTTGRAGRPGARRRARSRAVRATRAPSNLPLCLRLPGPDAATPAPLRAAASRRAEAGAEWPAPLVQGSAYPIYRPAPRTVGRCACSSARAWRYHWPGWPVRPASSSAGSTPARPAPG